MDGNFHSYVTVRLTSNPQNIIIQGDLGGMSDVYLIQSKTRGITPTMLYLTFDNLNSIPHKSRSVVHGVPLLNTENLVVCHNPPIQITADQLWPAVATLEITLRNEDGTIFSALNWDIVIVLGMKSKKINMDRTWGFTPQTELQHPLIHNINTVLRQN